MNFDQLQTNAANAVMKAFRLAGVLYFYEDRLSGERLAIDAVEMPLEFVTEDPATGVTVSRKGRGFLVVGSVVGAIDAWRVGLGYDVTGQPTPNRNDFIVVQKENETEKKYQIDKRDPYVTIGSNNAMYRFNTFLYS